MTSDQNKHTALRLQFLARVVRKECRHLISTEQRLFDTPFNIERAGQLETDPELSERVEVTGWCMNTWNRQTTCWE